MKSPVDLQKNSLFNVCKRPYWYSEESPLVFGKISEAIEGQKLPPLSPQASSYGFEQNPGTDLLKKTLINFTLHLWLDLCLKMVVTFHGEGHCLSSMWAGPARVEPLTAGGTCAPSPAPWASYSLPHMGPCPSWMDLDLGPSPGRDRIAKGFPGSILSLHRLPCPSGHSGQTDPRLHSLSVCFIQRGKNHCVCTLLADIRQEVRSLFLTTHLLPFHQHLTRL